MHAGQVFRDRVESRRPVNETPTTDPTAPAGPTPDAQPVQETPAAEPLPPAPPAPIELHVEGDRLAVPVGSSRRIWEPGHPTTSFFFLIVVSTISLASDIGTKLWAEKHLDGYPGTLELIKDHLTLILAKNRGGAWGLLQGTSENVRRPFFLLVSVAAIAFIMTLYRRLQPRQRALRWGLPLVLGGALGNVFDRVRYGHVIDFIDYHAEWIRKLNMFFRQDAASDHWPTFNIADVAICVGVGLMAVDMFTSKRPRAVGFSPRVPPAQAGEPAANHIAIAEALAAPLAAPPEAPPDAPPPDAPPPDASSDASASPPA
jgi:signal peptidase II